MFEWAMADGKPADLAAMTQRFPKQAQAAQPAA